MKTKLKVRKFILRPSLRSIVKVYQGGFRPAKYGIVTGHTIGSTDVMTSEKYDAREVVEVKQCNPVRNPDYYFDENRVRWIET